jgi:hypothetical protein
MASGYAALPAFCRVAGTIKPTSDSDIRFEVWMPAANWNGKFVGVGNGVWAGAISYAEMIAPLSKGYATAATDDGHQGNGLDASFAAGHPEKLIDFAYRAPHEMTVAAKATIAAFYEKSAIRSLFVSCSTGGRRLMERTGIRRLRRDRRWRHRIHGSTHDQLLVDGHAALKDKRLHPAPKVRARARQRSACDAMTVPSDGIISSPKTYQFDPRSFVLGRTTLRTASPHHRWQHCMLSTRDEESRTASRSTGWAGAKPVPSADHGSQDAFGAATTAMSSGFRDPQRDFRALTTTRTSLARGRPGATRWMFHRLGSIHSSMEGESFSSRTGGPTVSSQR